MKLVVFSLSTYALIFLILMTSTLFVIGQKRERKVSLKSILSFANHSSDYAYRFPELIDGRRYYNPAGPDIDTISLTRSLKEKF